MKTSRRQMLSLSALALGSSVLARADQSIAHSPSQSVIATPPTETPPIEIIALNRMGFGPRPGDLERVQQLGFAAYVDEQLNPQEDEDAIVHERIAAATLPIQYEAAKNFPAIKEDRPLKTLGEPLAQLWRLTQYEETPPYAEWSRPIEDIRAATWIRAVYSKWQLREVLGDFWHNHFNVKGFNGDIRLMLTFPRYDELMRRNCLGNFRSFLEEVAKSTPMLTYLNNASSKASPANENYARELLELHTLGADHYYNELYDRWRDVPGAARGKAEGYIDQDVYEAARAFTGWTIADGTNDGGNTFPNTGEFYYHDGWHDNYQKRVLGIEIPPNQPPLSDGLKVLDLLAYHPGTAKHLCTKLCRRLVADDPPQALVNQAVQTWMANAQSPDQIQQTVKTILLSSEFAKTWGQKVKRPLEVAVSFLRATDANFKYTFEVNYILESMGQSLFDWATPTGHPDRADYWLNTNVTLRRWHAPSDLMADWVGMGAAAFHLREQMPAEVTTSRQIVDFWVGRLLGRSLSDAAHAALLSFISRDQNPDEVPTSDPEDLHNRVQNLVALIATTPDFQLR
jgi:uncharacterized protein (DUF1800 family)